MLAIHFVVSRSIASTAYSLILKGARSPLLERPSLRSLHDLFRLDGAGILALVKPTDKNGVDDDFLTTILKPSSKTVVSPKLSDKNGS